MKSKKITAMLLLLAATAAGSVGINDTKAFASNHKDTVKSTINSLKRGTVVNIKTSLTVRKNASTSSKALGYLKNGSKVEIVSKSGSWYKIKYNKGYGYVQKDYIKETSTSNSNNNSNNNNTTKNSNSVNVATKEGIVVNIKSTLTVRKSESTSSEALGYLKNGSKVEIVSKSGSWYKIKYNKGYGYVYKDYIKETSTSNSNNNSNTNNSNNNNSNSNENNGNNNNNSTNKPENTVVAKKYGKVEVNSELRIREKADTTSRIIGNLKNNSVVEIVGEKNNFYNVKYNNVIGYSSKNFIEEISKKEADEIINNSQNGSGITSEIKTSYNVSMDSYIKAQQARFPSYSYESYEKYINPDKATNKYQFLRLDEFRNISVNGLNDYFDNMDAGVLKGHAQAFVDSAKQFGIDPLYFAAQSIHETGYGKSKLAKGVTISEIANPNKEIYNSKGQLIGYEMIKLKEPVTVYNLFGIGAYDNSSVFTNRALILGTTYAYNHGWTNVDKAIEGAAKFVSDNYVNSSRYNQNTLYKMRFAPNQDVMWHQYATTVWYASEIGEQMNEMSYLYIGNNDFIFDKPKFIESKTLKPTSFITTKEGNENLPQSSAHVSIENQNKQFL